MEQKPRWAEMCARILQQCEVILGGRDEVVAIAAALSAAGADVLHVTARRALRPEPFGEPLACTVRFAAAEKGLIANGGIRTLEDAEAALAGTGAQCVSLARALLANPDWMQRVTQGLPLAAYAPGMEKQPL